MLSVELPHVVQLVALGGLVLSLRLLRLLLMVVLVLELLGVLPLELLPMLLGVVGARLVRLLLVLIPPALLLLLVRILGLVVGWESTPVHQAALLTGGVVWRHGGGRGGRLSGARLHSATRLMW